MGRDEVRDGVPLTNLDQPLFEGAGADKRDLVDYLDAVRELLLGELRDRPLSVIRVVRGQAPFMQKNTPKYTPEWVATVPVWAEASKREVTYALCNDRRTLLWFANQRAVEYHPTLAPAGHAGVLPGAVGRARPGGARRLHRAHRTTAAGGKCPLGGADARPAVAQRGPDRRGAGDPDSPGPGHARRQAPRPRPPRPGGLVTPGERSPGGRRLAGSVL